MLATACERALVASARAERAGTRQLVRAAARRFVRRHRHDAEYLRFVLRSVGASSALAIALLGLGAAPASAKLAPFTSTPLDPLAGQDVGDFSAPAAADLDGDGDLDVVVGELGGAFFYYENTGSTTSPVFVPRTGSANPLGALDVGYRATPSFGDLDGDGDLDLVAGEFYGSFRYYENTGSPASPAFVLRTGALNPLAGQVSAINPSPSLGDVDGDGDLDLVAGQSPGTLNYYENTGSAISPAFLQRTGAANPLDGFSVVYQSRPSLADLDGDGDLDLVSGAFSGVFATFENTGSATSPAFVSRTGSQNPLDGQDIGSTSAPALSDLDGDGDPDLVSGKVDGTLQHFDNRGRSFAWRTGAANPLAGQDIGFSSVPALGDLDADGDLDLVAGEDYGFFRYFQNTGSAASPVFVQRTGAANPLNGLPVTQFSAAPALGDLDSDGDLDLVAGGFDGIFSYFENTGSAASPVFVLRTGSANPLAGQNVGILGMYSVPALGDLDGDGDLDVLAGASTGTFTYFENTGSAGSAAFVQRTGAANPLNGWDVGTHAKPALADSDADGDLDLACGGSSLPMAGGPLLYFANTGSATSPVFVPRFFFRSPLPFVGSVDTLLSLSGGDLDDDGDLDLVVGGVNGGFQYLESFVGQTPGAVAQTGVQNPLDGEDVGAYSVPALGDLDGDGDFDLIAGRLDADFSYFQNTGDAETPLFAAPLANPFGLTAMGSDFSAPTLGDLDGDGDLDLVAGESAGTFAYFQNTGSAIGAAFVQRTGAANPLGDQDVGSASSPVLADLDDDGDLDLVAGKNDGAFAYFQNTGNAATPSFVLRTGSANPLEGRDAGILSRPSLADFDGDGDLDLVAGESTGQFRWFKNDGSVQDPLFAASATGVANPLAGADVGTLSAPAAADLDGDGMPDLVTGSQAGTFAVHFLPEPGHGALLGAGLALLAWLDRLRGSRNR